MAAVRLWNPANVVSFLDEYYRKHGFGDFTHYYLNEKGIANEWKIIKLGTTGFKPREHSRPIPYYSQYLSVTPAQFVNYSFSGDKTSIRNARFYKTDDASVAGKTVSILCNFAILVVAAMFDERETLPSSLPSSKFPNRNRSSALCHQRG